MGPVVYFAVRRRTLDKYSSLLGEPHTPETTCWKTSSVRFNAPTTTHIRLEPPTQMSLETNMRHGARHHPLEPQTAESNDARSCC